MGAGCAGIRCETHADTPARLRAFDCEHQTGAERRT